MSTQNISNKQIRDIQRAVHLLAALLLLLYFYTPLGSATLFTTILQFFVLPLLVITGMLMWQWTRLRKRFNTASGRAAVPQRKPVTQENN